MRVFLFCKNNSVFILLLSLVSILTWIRLLNNGFLVAWDDGSQIYQPEIAKLSWQNLKIIFSSKYVGMYQPLSSAVYSILNTIDAFNPAVFHGFSVLLHTVNVIVVYVLLKKLPIPKLWQILVSFVFAVHPIQQEAVAWVSATSTPIYFFFYIFAMYYYVRYLNENRSVYYLIVWVCFVFSCLAKVNAITLPAVLIALDFLFHKPWFSWKSLLKKLPFILVSIVFGLIVIYDRANYTQEAKQGLSYSFWSIFIYQIFFLLKEFFFFFDITAIYEYPRSLPLPAIVASYALFLVALVYAIKSRNRLFIFALVFYIVNIVLVTGVFGYTMGFSFARYFYILIIPVMLAMCSILPPLNFKKLNYVLIVLVACLATTSFVDAANWKDNKTLLKSILEVNPKSPTALYHLSYVISKQDEDIEKNIDEAFYYANQIDPRDTYYMARVAPITSSYYLKNKEYRKALDILENVPELNLLNIRQVYDNIVKATIALDEPQKLIIYTNNFIGIMAQHDKITLDDYRKIFQTYYNLGMHQEALNTLRLITYFITNKSTENMHNIHRVYEFKSRIFQTMKLRDSAISALDQAKQSALRYNNDIDLVKYYENLALDYQKTTD